MRKTKFHILALVLAMMLMLTTCAAPALAADAVSGIGIQITPPTGWTNRDANVAVTLTDSAGNGFERAMVKGEGDWKDITPELEREGSRYSAVLTLSGNCAVTVRVTGWDGQTYEESRTVSCFDKTAPALRTSFTAKALHVEAIDTASGVAAVYVDGRGYTALTNGAVDVPLSEIGTDADKISVQAEDHAGNRSQAVTVENPNYKSAANEPVSTTKPVQTTPAATVKPTTPATTPSKGGDTPAVSAPQEPEEKPSAALTPEGNLSLTDDIDSAGPEEKQFITVTTKNGNYFYLIIDRAEDGENTVHFLNQVDEADLLALMEDGTVTPAVCSCDGKCKAGAVNTSCELCAVDMTECAGKEPPPEPDPEPDPAPDPDPEPQRKDGKSGLLVVVLAVALAGGGAVYFLKFKKAKPDTRGSANLDDYDYGDGEDEPDEDEAGDGDA